jgi:hypothetical protein
MIIFPVRENLMPTIVVQVRTPASRAANSIVPEFLAEAARRLGLTLVPQFAGATDPELARYYVAEAPAAADVEAAAAALRALNDVDAAYVQPEAAPPGL